MSVSSTSGSSTSNSPSSLSGTGTSARRFGTKVGALGRSVENAKDPSRSLGISPTFLYIIRRIFLGAGFAFIDSIEWYNWIIWSKGVSETDLVSVLVISLQCQTEAYLKCLISKEFLEKNPNNSLLFEQIVSWLEILQCFDRRYNVFPKIRVIDIIANWNSNQWKTCICIKGSYPDTWHDIWR